MADSRSPMYPRALSAFVSPASGSPPGRDRAGDRGTGLHVAVRLRSAATTLSQVVVVGYGTQRRPTSRARSRRSRLTSSRRPSRRSSRRCRARHPACRSRRRPAPRAAASPSASAARRPINGNSEPLYVIDGFPIENDPTNQGNPSDAGRESTHGPTNPLASAQPERHRVDRESSRTHRPPRSTARAARTASSSSRRSAADGAIRKSRSTRTAARRTSRSATIC